MAINKVIYGNNTIIDLTTDTITASKMMAGETAHDRSGNQIVGTGDITGSDISNKTVTFTEASERTNISSGETTATLFGKIKKFFSDLKAVAFSGSYNDLIDTPTIPTVNNATLTIQKNGTNVKTFTANASSNVTANITVPTKVSDLTNDSGFLTSPVAIADGGTGATSRINACKALFNSNVTSPNQVLTLTNSWGSAGYSTLAQLKSAMGIGTIVTNDTTNIVVPSETETTLASVSLTAGKWIVTVLAGMSSQTTSFGVGVLLATDSSATMSTANSVIVGTSIGSPIRIEKTSIFDLSATTTVYSRGYHNYGNNRNMFGRIKAIRIA